jgi:hypothetical protein
MTFRDLYEFQQLVFRAYMQNMMFLATLPFQLARETRRDSTSERASRPARNFRREDVRWLR